MEGNQNTKSKRFPREKVFIVNESYAGIKSLSDIFADLLYSAYCKREPDGKGKSPLQGSGFNHNGYLPDMNGHKHYGDGAY